MKEINRGEITQISKDFAKGMFGSEPIGGLSVLLTDPLAGYLSFLGFENKVFQVPHPIDKTPVLIIEFSDGSRFIPTGSDLSVEAGDFFWIDKKLPKQDSHFSNPLNR